MAGLKFKLIVFVAAIFWARNIKALTSTTPSPSELSFVTDVNEIQPSVTTDMTLTCTMPAVGLTGQRTMMSMVISKLNTQLNKFEELYTITMFDDHRVQVIEDVGAKVTGYLRTNHTSSLRLHWTYPGQSEAGEYVCESNTIDRIGRTENNRAALKISTSTVGDDSLTESLREMKETVRNLTDTVWSLNYTVSNQKSSLSSLWNKYYDVTKTIRDAKEVIFDETYVRIDGLRLVYTKSPYYSYDTAQATCALLGGKLAELSPQKFFSKRVDMMNQGYSHFSWLGAMHVNGSMIYPSTGQPVDFSASVLPDNDQCMILNQNATTVYYTDCRSHVPYHALCTVV